MTSDPHRQRKLGLSVRHAWRASLVALLCACLGVREAHAQIFSSGSDGSDGIYAPSGPPGTVVVFNPSQFTGTNVAAGIFNFTTISIPSGVTVRLPGTAINGPVYWLAQGDVNIQGTIDLRGGDGIGSSTNPFTRVAAQPGAGGYIGGVGGNQTQEPLKGGGPGGGDPGPNPCNAGNPNGRGGTFSGNSFLIPLTGGSGGGGARNCSPSFGGGGGAGGGALMIASSGTITVAGTITANGGFGNGPSYGGGGSGGAIRLVAQVVTGTGNLRAQGGGTGGSFSGGAGYVRIEGFTTSFTGLIDANWRVSSPFPLLLPTAGVPSARVVSINGVAITPNPATFPDITLNTTAPVPVVIETHNIPTTAIVNLTILNQNGVPDTVIQTPPIGNCDQNNFCTTTVNVVFPFGAARGLTKVTWTP